MKKKIIVLLSILLVCIIGIYIYFNINEKYNKQTQSPTTTTLNNEINETDSKIEENITTPEEETEVIKVDIDNSTIEKENTTTKKDSNSNKEQSKQKAINNNHTETKQEIVSSSTPEDNNNSIENNTSNNEVIEDTTPTPTKEENKYIGVPDPNNFNYSFHNGKIEYKTEQACRDDWNIIGFKDTVDIINGWCVDVRDSNNTILGYYLYINCSSGNCNKYKN